MDPAAPPATKLLRCYRNAEAQALSLTAPVSLAIAGGLHSAASTFLGGNLWHGGAVLLSLSYMRNTCVDSVAYQRGKRRDQQLE